jgi:hypothetical protein
MQKKIQNLFYIKYNIHCGSESTNLSLFILLLPISFFLGSYRIFLYILSTTPRFFRYFRCLLRLTGRHREYSKIKAQQVTVMRTMVLRPLTRLYIRTCSMEEVPTIRQRLHKIKILQVPFLPKAIQIHNSLFVVTL